MKRLLKIVGIVIAVLLLIVIALPFIIDVNTFRPKIESELSTALGRQVSIGNLHLSLLTGSVSADDLAIADDPAFGKQPFIKAKGLDVGVEVLPLIFSKTLNVTELALDTPQVSLVRTPSGKWNFSSLGSKTSASGTPTGAPAREPASNPGSEKGTRPQTTESAARPAVKSEKGTASAEPSTKTENPNLSIAKLTVKNGSIAISDANSPGKARIYKNVDITVKDFSFTSQFPFTLTASLPGGGDVKLDGKAGPIDQSDASLTPLEAKIEVKKLDLAASGFVDPSSGIAGLIDFNGTVTSDGHQAKASGTALADKLKLSPKGSPAPTPVNLKFATVYELQAQTGQLTEGTVTVGKAVAKLTGGYRIEPSEAVLNLKLNADGMPVDDLEAMLPALGVTLPSGSSLKGGTLSTDFTISGPVNKLVINGPVKLVNTKLAGFNLGSKLSAVSALSGAKTGSDTEIQNFSADAHVAPEGVTTQNVNLTVPSLGVITGNGTVSPQNALNFHMSANINGSVVTGLTQMAGLGNKGGTIPFFIQGTTSDPKFVPDVKGMVGSQLGGLKSAFTGQQNGQQNGQSIVNGLTGLLGKKKQK